MPNPPSPMKPNPTPALPLPPVEVLPPMKKWNVLIHANDGRPFYQNFHVIEGSSGAAAQYLLANFPSPKIRSTVKGLRRVDRLND